MYTVPVMDIPRFLRRNKKRIKWSVFATLLLVVTILFVQFGWRLDGFGIVRGQEIIITDLPDESVVYLNSIRLGETSGNTHTIRVSPGTHTIIVESPNRWPWHEEVLVSKEHGVTIRAFLSSVAVSGEVLAEGTDEYRHAQEVLQKTSLPSMNTPLEDATLPYHFFVEDNAIIAESVEGTSLPSSWCLDAPCARAVIYEPIETIRSLTFFPKRNDHFLVGFRSSIVALEIDPRAPRTYQPILEGSEPRIARDTHDTIYGRDLSTIFRLDF